MLYFIAETVSVECISWWTKKRGNLFFLSLTPTKDSVYSVPIGNYFGCVITLSLIVIEADGSRSLIAMKIILCFTGRLTEFSDSELPNSKVIEVT